MKKIILQYGLISGGLIGGTLLITIPFIENMDFKYGMLIGYTSMVLAFSLIYFAALRFKKENGDKINFKQAISIGLMITALACLIYTIVWMILYSTVLPDFMTKYTDHMIQKLKSSGADEVEVEKQIAALYKNAEYYKNPFFRFLITFTEPLFVGLAISFIAALLVRTKKVNSGLTA